jgi:hypothetical protein
MPASSYTEAFKETTSSFSQDGMKLRIFSEVTAAAIMGGAFGLHMHGNYVKWNAAGRAAYLTDQSIRFDKYFAVPKTAASEVILIIVMAVLVYVVYKGIALAIETGLSAIQGRRTIQATPDHFPHAE